MFKLHFPVADFSLLDIHQTSGFPSTNLQLESSKGQQACVLHAVGYLFHGIDGIRPVPATTSHVQQLPVGCRAVHHQVSLQKVCHMELDDNIN
jgi:hypothetical protein